MVGSGPHTKFIEPAGVAVYIKSAGGKSGRPALQSGIRIGQRYPEALFGLINGIQSPFGRQSSNTAAFLFRKSHPAQHLPLQLNILPARADITVCFDLLHRRLDMAVGPAGINKAEMAGRTHAPQRVQSRCRHMPLAVCQCAVHI